MSPIRSVLRIARTFPSPLLLAFTLGVATSTCCASLAVAQESTHTAAPGVTSAPVTASAPERTAQQSDVSSATEPASKRFAVTLNPLNFLIGRYGFNFEYQPMLHHGLIVTPHYDHVVSGSSDDPYTQTLNNGRVEIGYRLYTGSQGFDGFFVGPSFLLATGKVHLEAPAGIVAEPSINRSFSTIGCALDAGGQLQIDHLVIGAGVGVQYTRATQDLYYIPVPLEILAGGRNGLLPRLLVSLGYAL